MEYCRTKIIHVKSSSWVSYRMFLGVGLSCLTALTALMAGGNAYHLCVRHCLSPSGWAQERGRPHEDGIMCYIVRKYGWVECVYKCSVHIRMAAFGSNTKYITVLPCNREHKRKMLPLAARISDEKGKTLDLIELVGNGVHETVTVV